MSPDQQVERNKSTVINTNNHGSCSVSPDLVDTEVAVTENEDDSEVKIGDEKGDDNDTEEKNPPDSGEDRRRLRSNPGKQPVDATRVRRSMRVFARTISNELISDGSSSSTDVQ